MALRATTSQTVGPFFHLGLEWLFRAEVAHEGVPGERVTIEGRVVDGDGAPVPDALLELWQANTHGKYDHPEDTQDKPLEPGFHGYGRVCTDAAGRFSFRTVKPGPVPAPDGTQQAPHILVSFFARGLQRRLITRIYFPDEPANDSDFVLRRVPPARRGTLVARPRAASLAHLEWNVVLQGPAETVFFEL